MIPEFLKLVNQEDSGIIVFLMKLILSIISPTFCVIFILYPTLFKNFQLEVILILGCSINIIMISIMYSLLSFKIKVINRIQLKHQHSLYYKEFIRAKKQCISNISKSILNIISNYIIIMAITIIVVGIVSKYTYRFMGFKVAMIVLLIMGLILAVIILVFFSIEKKCIKDSSEELKNSIEKSDYFEFI